jgi:hypothetical protein
MLPDFSRFAENIDVTASVRNLPDHMLIIDRLLDFADVQGKYMEIYVADCYDFD